MKSFSVKELERFSGVKAHTIRIWEQRYAIFMPDRTEGNTRAEAGGLRILYLGTNIAPGCLQKSQKPLNQVRGLTDIYFPRCIGV